MPNQPPEYNPFHLVPESDYPYVEKMGAEIFHLYFHPVPFYVLDRQRTAVDPLYNESAGKQFANPVNVLMWTMRNPRQRILTRFGFDTPRDILIVFNNRDMFDHNMKLPDIGDRFDLDGGKYEIKSVQAMGRWYNVDLRLYTAAVADKVRKERFTPPQNSPASKPITDKDLYV